MTDPLIRSEHVVGSCLKHDRTARTIITGHAFIQNLRRGHYELGLHARTRHLRLAATFDELAEAI